MTFASSCYGIAFRRSKEISNSFTMLDFTNTTNVAFGAGVLLAVMYMCYRRALPKPLKGIPYNEEAVNNLFGDIPSLMKEMNSRGDFFLWIREQNRMAQSAISQVFITPFGKPLVVLSDVRESRDIQLNRAKEFDRSWFIHDMFIPLTGETQFTTKTGPKWKLFRRLTQDTMTPSFLREVAAPSIYASCLRFVDLWNTKAEIANGQPFSAVSDLFYVTLDAVLAFNFGSDFPLSATRSQVEGMEKLSAGDVSGANAGPDDPVKFPEFDVGDDISSLLGLVKTMDGIAGKPLSKLLWYLAKMSPSWRRMEKTKNELLRRQIANSVEKLVQHKQGDGESLARNGVDLIVRKEAKLAEKDNRKPEFFADMIMAEVSSFDQHRRLKPYLAQQNKKTLQVMPTNMGSPAAIRTSGSRSRYDQFDSVLVHEVLVKVSRLPDSLAPGPTVCIRGSIL